jgi:hypothetical protein
MTFYFRKMYINVSSKSNKAEKIRKNLLFIGVLKVKDENIRIQTRIQWSKAQTRGSVSVPKCHGSTTLKHKKRPGFQELKKEKAKNGVVI